MPDGTAQNGSDALPDGIFSLFDTDLYKLTMQSAVLKYFPDVQVTYAFTNRTPNMKLSRSAFHWLQKQVEKLGNITLTTDELQFLRKTCSYLSEPYLHFLETFRLRPSEHIKLEFQPSSDTGGDDDVGDIEIHTAGLWVDTILYEIPLLALTSEAYFKFIDKDWTHDGQVENAREKGLQLMEHGCMFSEFGSRRRRDYRTHELVVKGLIEAKEEAAKRGYSGKLTGTSNVHFAMKLGIAPIGTVAHEWFMGVAAMIGNYNAATEAALTYWVATFGKGVLGIALTDTFGTPTFLKSFSKPVPQRTIPGMGGVTTSASSGDRSEASLSSTNPPIQSIASHPEDDGASDKPQSFAEVFTGVRQDSGNPLDFIKLMRDYYDREGIKEKKTIVFSDSLNVDRCIEYKEATEKAGLQPSFGVGTFFTNDFKNKSNGKKSVPLNIVIKLATANGHPAVKISDDIGKNTGDHNQVEEVKRQLGYTEKSWEGGDESARWGKGGKA